jgi:hypothetical protein
MRQYITTEVKKTIAISIPDSSALDTVQIQILQVSTSYTWDFYALAFSADPTVGNMSLISSAIGKDWIASFTPDKDDEYVVTVKVLYADTSQTILTPIYFTAINELPAEAPLETPPEAASGKNTLEMLNYILIRTGYPYPGILNLENLEEDSGQIFATMSDVSIDIARMFRWRLLRKKATITLTATDNEYTVATGLYNIDETSFFFDTNNPLSYLKRSEWSKKIYQSDIVESNSGDPEYITWEGDKFIIDKLPGEGNAGKTITYYYYQMPAEFSTISPTARSWFPAGFETSVLCNSVIFETLTFREENPTEAAKYFQLKEKALQNMRFYYEDIIKNKLKGLPL